MDRQISSRIFAPWALGMVFFLLAGCAGPTVTYHRVEPAEMDLKGVKRIAINRVYGPGSDVIREYIANAIVQSGKFELDEMGQADGFLTVRVLRYGCRDKRGTKRVQEERGTGRYHKVKERKYGLFGPEEWVEREIMEKVWVTKPYLVRYCSVKASFEFTRVDGTVLATKVEQENYKKEAVGDEEIAALPLQEEILNQLTDTVIQRLMTRIVPHEVTETRELEFGSCVGAGNKAAQVGDWHTAIELYRPCTQKRDEAPAAYYNMGVAYEAGGDYVKAIAMYKKAVALRPCAKFSEALVRARKALADRQRLKARLRR